MPATRYGMLVDFELVKRAQGGDAVAFKELVLAYRKRILGTIARLIGHPDDVEDVARRCSCACIFRSTSSGRRKYLSRGCTG